MNSEIRRLEQWGAKPSYGVARLLGDEIFYWQMVHEFRDSRDIDILQILMKQKDYSNVFLVAHSMKGASLSLSLQPLTEALADLVDRVRPFYDKQRTQPESAAEEAEIENSMKAVTEQWEVFERLLG